MIMPCPIKPNNPTKISHNHTKKGAVHWFDLEDNVDPKISSQKARPYIIIDSSSYSSSRVIISPITDRNHCIEEGTNKLKYPSNAPLNKKQNPFLDKDSIVLLDQVYTIGKDELCEEWYMGQITDLQKIDEAIMYNYDLFDSMFTIYKKLFNQLNGQAKSNYISQYSRK
ncbi:hypothetical protein EJM73_09515 [Clostridium botulinum]|uniref:type II toxin-antitoxin system PemK/MazF family toxin n=1 Tax=Clostridium botulinum TaxID=1491 RepID=UPI0013761230|nr:type II toxin-antitoxin system PemK/MazF family toxin [Clostridium botulinum]NCI19863.1 hypothetical protein [Clostridium botulinum]NCI35901.1 hypothetical protein [Clostridium botulinum]NCI71758.1 hypothetical protein [Clostridium botulinum]NDI38674.1 hypothetical protein [Clostridium botulinum]